MSREITIKAEFTQEGFEDFLDSVLEGAELKDAIAEIENNLSETEGVTSVKVTVK